MGKMCENCFLGVPNMVQGDPLEHLNGTQLFMADRWPHIEAVCIKIKISYCQDSFWENGQNVWKLFVWVPNRVQRVPLEHFNGTQPFIGDTWPHIEAVCIKINKVTEQFLRKWAKCVKTAFWGPEQGPGGALRAFQWDPALYGR